MLAITNQERFNKIVSNALEAAITNAKTETDAKRWARAIEKAVEKIEEQPEWLHYDETENYLLIWSQTSGEIYSSNGVCQCKAYQQKQPCWHRAAARLVRIYFGGAENKTPRFPNEPQASVANIPPPADLCSVCTTKKANADTGKCGGCEQDTAPYFKPASAKKPERIGGIRI